MRTILFVLFVCFLQSVSATTYYFSSVSGNDSRSSSEARNSSTPWKSLSKLNSFFSSLQPGDAVLLKRGETFYGSIVVNKSGTSSSPIVIGAYGSGDKPVVTSLVTLGGWVSKGNGIWESYNSAFSGQVNMLLLNGVEQELGRYPNSNASNKGYLIYESHYSTSSITDNQLTSATNWTGAELVIRGRRWILDRNLITSHSGTKISYKANSSYSPYNNNGYFIQKSIKTLDKFGEWYYNPSSKKISVYFGSNSPSSYNIQAATKDNLIFAEKFSNVKFNDLNIKGSNASAVYIKYTSNNSLQNCDVEFSGKDGIEAKFDSRFKVENSTISNSNNTGINLGYSGDYAVIRNNKISNASMFAGMGSSNDNNGMGIMSFGDYNIIEYNEIKNTGHSGIIFSGNYVTIKNNLIDGFCNTKDDGAGIYTHIGSASSCTGRKINGNIILNGKGAPAGTDNPSYSAAEGIYADNNAANVEIAGNTIANCVNQGIYIHSSYAISITNNTLFNNKRQLAMIEDKDNSKIRNCTISNNVVFSKLSSQTLSYLKSYYSDVKYFGKFSSNYYASPSNNNISSLLDQVQTVDTYAKILSFQNDTRFEYNATSSDKTVSLDASYVDVKGNRYSSSFTLRPYTSVVLIKSSQTFTSTTSPVVSITSPTQNATYKTGATINITANASDADGSISKVEFYKGTTLLHTETSAPYNWDWTNVSAGNYTLTAKATDNSGHVTTSAGVSISVTSSTYPTVSITSPTKGATYKSGATVYITANASDADGTVSKVEFYRGTTLLHTEKSAPYRYDWSNVSAGNYTLTAKATDNSGHVTTSSSVSISVAAARPGGANNSDSAKIAMAIPTMNEGASLDFRLFPNPAVNTIKVNFNLQQRNQKTNISIYSLTGSLLKSIPLMSSASTVEIDISSLSSGTYIMQFTGEKFKMNKKFIKLY
jgi:parallel beta-helix repeat protein